MLREIAPAKYSEELGRRICDKIASEYKSVAKLHEENKKWFPEKSTVFDWVANNQQFGRMFIEAKQKQATLGAERIEEINEQLLKSTYIDEKGRERIDPAAIAAQKVIADNIKWCISKLCRPLYGDKVDVNHNVRMHEDWLNILK